MESRRTSVTAEVIAAARAVESCRPPKKRLFEDPFARSFITKRSRRALIQLACLLRAYDAFNRFGDRSVDLPGVMLGFCCRTKYIDDALRDALKAGCRQVVILGAGYDTRAYRISGIEQAKVFEVDHPVTQQSKRGRIERLIGKIPEHVTLVPVDFGRQELGVALQQAGLQPRESTFFIFEGVTQYVVREGVESTLRFVGSSALGSQIIFTYVHRGVIDGTKEFKRAQKLMQFCQDRGEPWVFGVLPEEVPQFLKICGLDVIEHWLENDLARCLYPLGRRGPLSGITNLVLAAPHF